MNQYAGLNVSLSIICRGLKNQRKSCIVYRKSMQVIPSFPFF